MKPIHYSKAAMLSKHELIEIVYPEVAEGRIVDLPKNLWSKYHPPSHIYDRRLNRVVNLIDKGIEQGKFYKKKEALLMKFIFPQITPETFLFKFPDFIKFNNITVEGIDRKDHPDYVDAFISEAYYEDQELTEKELDALNDFFPEFVNEYITSNNL